MADRSVAQIMRDAILNAETGSAFISKNPTMGSDLETILLSTTKGSKILCGVGIETMLNSSAWTTTAAGKQGRMVDDLFIKIDNQLRIKSSSPAALIEWADRVLDKVQYDDPQVGTGAGNDGGHSFHIYPVSGVGGRQVQIDIDVASYVSMITTGTYASSYIKITPYYSDMPMPVFSVVTGGSPATGTGAYKLNVSGDFVGNGFLESGVIIGDGTFDNDDFRIIQEDGKMLLNQKARFLDTVIDSPLKLYDQNLHQKTLLTNSGGFRVISTVPWNINSVIEFDVSTSGTFQWCLIFKNSSTAGNEKIAGEPATPAPEPVRQPATAQTSGQNTRNIATMDVNTGRTGFGTRARQLLRVR